MAQLLDIGPFFRILISSGKNCTFICLPTTLLLEIGVILPKLSECEQIVLATGKSNVLKDYITIALEMISKSFT